MAQAPGAPEPAGGEGSDRPANSIARRSVLQWTGGVLGASSLGIPTGTAGAFAKPRAEPVSMAMHIHSSFSEGAASMDAHLYQASRLGVDVIWWTDHDFRASAFGYRSAVGFDAEHEAEGPWDLSWQPVERGPIGAVGHEFVAWPHSPDEAGGALRIEVTGQDSSAWSSYLMQAMAENSLYSTSYSDTALLLDVRPEQLGLDAQILVEVVSSYRPATAGRPAGQYRLQYRIGSSRIGHHLEEDGLVGVINVPAGPPDQWQRVRMDLRADHATLWPDTFAGDASLKKLLIGARARNSATARVVVDRLRFLRARRNSADALQLQREAMEVYRERYPTVTQFGAAEVSLVMHLNAFGGDQTRLDYDMRYAVKDSSVAAQRAMVDFLHGHRAVVGINHPLSSSGGARNLARRLVTTRGVGADVIEIGTTPDVSTLERVFDIAARNAVFLTANGSTDDHNGENWLGSGRRWLTSVWSPSRRQVDLCHALKAGRAWFYDPLHWRGAFDLLVDGTTKMGGVHFTAKHHVPLDVTARHLPADSSLELVVGRCDRPGVTRLTAAVTRTAVPRSRMARGHWTTDITRGHGVYVRVMVRSSTGHVIGFSNPVWVLPRYLDGRIDVPSARR
ncbi:MAG: hypothetical protein H0V07_05195 [Propionibacteriales bacterium]|nr:hypothetical protein [Propionibacteriales bacterium]